MDEDFLSPCNKNCNIYGQYCRACYRSLNEIMAWNFLSNNEKEIILNSLEQRKSYIPESVKVNL